jgi:hypothetical protein
MTLNKTFRISLIIFGIIALFTAIYFFVFRSPSNSSEKQIIKTNEIGEENFDSLPTITKKITNITSEPVISAVFNSANTQIRYYSGMDGTLWEITDRGTNATQISKDEFFNIKSINWSNNKNQAIITFNDGKIIIDKHQESELDLDLKNEIDKAIWTNNDNKIITQYFNQETKERSLNTSTLEYEDEKKIADLPFRYANFLQIPSSIQAAFWPSPDASLNTELFKSSIINFREPERIFTNKFGADFLFSPDGKNFLVSYVITEGGEKINLGIAKTQNGAFQDLQVPTLVQKVVWSKDNKTIYYAQPNSIPAGSIMPNDYLAKKFATQDTFWKMDVTTGKKERLVELADLTEVIDAVNLFLSPTEDALFFINRTNGLLYRLNMD